jgi:hypothetical protein
MIFPEMQWPYRGYTITIPCGVVYKANFLFGHLHSAYSDSIKAYNSSQKFAIQV